MRRPGTPSDAAAASGAEAYAFDAAKVASELEAIGRDLASGGVPDAELLRRIEAFADLFLRADKSASGLMDGVPGPR